MRVKVWKIDVKRWFVDCIEYPGINFMTDSPLSDVPREFEEEAELFFKQNPNELMCESDAEIEETWSLRSDFQRIGYIGDRIYLMAIM